ncbi:Fic family protein [Candidatus Micrarchaeota archaeon]|nr:Fic family protein [Candidatus Micrarchaeota archaeon]
MAIDENIYERILQKKKELEKLRPFNQGALKKLKDSFNVELTYNSNAIEGNSLTLSETRLVLEEGITIGGKLLKEHFEVTNHQKAIEFVETLVKKPKIEELDILNIHAIILDRIDPENAGFYRKWGVKITGTNYTPPNPAKVPRLMQEIFSLFNSKTAELIETGARIHMKFVDIHPFVDGNGRTARLLLNLYFMRHGYPPVIILRAERSKYIRSIVSAQTKGDFQPFINFIAKAVERSLDIYLDCLGTHPKEYLSLSEAAKFSKHSAEYLSLLSRTGKIEAVKFGRNWKITREAIKEYEEKH